MISHINKLVKDYEHAKTATNINLNPHRSLSYIKWEAPPVGWVKLNTKGVRYKHDNTSYGGIIRGSDCEWLLGFSKYVGISSVYITEL